jgi:hypothetical protein
MKKTIACKACQSVNDYEAESCARCGESLALPRVEAIAADMRAITARLEHQQAVHAKGFSSINGFGTMLLDYRPHGDGTWQAVRWVTAGGIPLVPLGGYVIQPFHEEFTYGRHTASFSIVDRVPLSAQRIVRTYLLLAAGVLPLLLGALNSRWVNRTLGEGPAFFAMLACIAWAGYVVYARIPNAGKVYKRLPPRVAA